MISDALSFCLLKVAVNGRNMRLVLTLCFFASAFAANSAKEDNTLRFRQRGGHSGEHWALLVAGSNNWYNYRHQADVCHAYQVLRRHGFPKNRIITMMYDDIAYNSRNPVQGQIINHPLGRNVYEGVQIDYKGEDVTPENFLAVLSGNRSAVIDVGSGRVINSGPNDHIFVNFVDHGAPGILAFPQSELHARELISTIKYMHHKRKYKQMVVYVEACESGSMFQHLLSRHVNVYATTAANAHESSYACYYDETRNTYLGDVYSVKWMEDSDKENLGKESLHKQYEIVKEETNTSHVRQYGDVNISTEVVGEFQGEVNYRAPEPQYLPEVKFDAVPAEEVRATVLRHRLIDAHEEHEKLEILSEFEEMVKEKEQIETTVRHIVAVATKDHSLTKHIMDSRLDLVDLDCYEFVVKAFDKHCYDLSQHEYALRKLYPFVNMCEEKVSPNNIVAAIDVICRVNV